MKAVQFLRINYLITIGFGGFCRLVTKVVACEVGKCQLTL